MARMKKAQVRIVLRHNFGSVRAEIETSNDAGRTWALSSSHPCFAPTKNRGYAVSIDILAVLSHECCTFDRQFVGVRSALQGEEEIAW